MEILIATAVLGFLIKRGVVDTAAMITGNTPPSHAYRMAKLRQAQQRRQVDPDSDTRGGAKRVLAHWYRDACEDVDEWRANRRKTKPERKAAKEARKSRRRAVIDGVAQRLGKKDRSKPAGAPEVPDNVIPLDRARRHGTDDAGTGPGPQGAPPVPEQPPRGLGPTGTRTAPQGQDPGAPGPPSPDGSTDETRGKGDDVSADAADAPTADQAGLTPHLAVLKAARSYCSETVADVDRIRSQMEAHGVGEQVTGTAGTATDAANAADAQLGKAEQVLEDINRKVLEQLDASNHQAGDKAYLEPEQTTSK